MMTNAGRFRSTCVLLAMSVLPTVGAAQTLEDWTVHRDRLLMDPDLVRYYTFEAAPEGGVILRSLVGPEAPLAYGVVGEASEEERVLRVIPGRLPGKPAVRLDRGFLSGPQFPVHNRTFSVEAWVRTHGQGAIAGDDGPQSGTLLSEGIGYWDGWRLTISYPGGTLGFELGKRPGAEQLRTGPTVDGVWHHIVLTWDGQTKCIYLDGALAAWAPYAQDYVNPDPTAPFRVGYAGYGWGSAVADYDEIAVYRRALTSVQVLQHALYHVRMDPVLAEQIAQLDAAARRGELEVAASGYEQVLQRADLHPHLVAAVRLRLASVYVERKRVEPAVEQYAAVLAISDVPEGMRSGAMTPLVTLAQQSVDMPASVLEELVQQARALAPRQQAAVRLALARAYGREGKTEAARSHFEAVMTMPELSAREKLDLALQTAHALCQAGRYADARAEYERIAAEPDAPAQYRAHATLCAARSCVLEGQLDRAQATYQQVADMADVPPILRWEAQECRREVARLQQGLPARDPAWDRVQLPDLPEPAVEVWVSPDGADDAPGTRERPLASLTAAQEAVRAIGRRGLPAGGVRINLLPGEYPVAETLRFAAADSGTAQAPIVWRATEPGRAVLTGGRRVTGLTPVTDPDILERLPEEARGKVWQVSLPAAGITDFGELKPRGFGHGGGHPQLEVFTDGEPLTPARWPNEGFVRVQQVVSNDETGAVFICAEDRITRWSRAKDPWYFGYPMWQWADQRDPITELDAPARQIRLGGKVSYGGLSAGSPYFVYNLLEEIDQPGEWYLDRETGTLYLYPTGDPATTELVISMLPTPLLQADGASWLIWQGLTLEYGRWHGAVIGGGEHCLLAACTIRNCGGDAVQINGGDSHGLFGCELYNLGRGGSVITGGDRKTLTPGGHFIENCDVHHFSRVDRTYTPAVLMNGCGNRIAHNRFHHSPCHAMRIEGNDHVIEFNEVYEMVRESDDQGGLDMWANPSYRGVVIRYNYWHDIGTPYDTPCGQAGIRLDDAISGIWVYGNVFQRCSTSAFGAVQLHGGKDDVIVNNVFADCKYGISFSGWGPARWKEFLDSAWVQKMLYEDVDIGSPPYSTRYPELARLYEDEGVHQIWRNVAFNCGSFLTRDRGIQDLMDNQVSVSDPGFAASWQGDFTLATDSPLSRGPAFRPIPFEEIGIYDHPLRVGP